MGKNRFKPNSSTGDYYAAMMASKKCEPALAWQENRRIGAISGHKTLQLCCEAWSDLAASLSRCLSRANKVASREKRKDSPREELKRRQRELADEKARLSLSTRFTSTAAADASGSWIHVASCWNLSQLSVSDLAAETVCVCSAGRQGRRLVRPVKTPRWR